MYHKESGRAMIEIIGVLFIIGLITMGGFSGKSNHKSSSTTSSTAGITGYKTAMDQIGATETLSELNERYISAKMHLSMGHKNISDEYGARTRRGYPCRMEIVTTDTFKISLTNIPRSICTPLLHRNWDLPKQILLNGTLYNGTTTCTDNNTIDFIFQR